MTRRPQSSIANRHSSIAISPDVAAALAANRPIVALESAVITAGLPREPVPTTSRFRIEGWQRDQPINLELARSMERTVRAAGAFPATVAVLDGQVHIGLSDAQLMALALHPDAGKASASNLAYALNAGGFAGTTVSGTLSALAAQSSIVDRQSSISTFATGGIGGVHRNWQTLPDISADLRAIASTPVCIVCAGAKSILDLPATLEALEMLQVPVIGYRTNRFPQFQSTGSDDITLTQRVDDVEAAARICHAHWSILKSTTGIILANPVPEEFALEASELDQAIQLAELSAAKHKIAGSERTPFLLAELNRLTHGRALDANLALLLSNARLAAEMAQALLRP